MEYIIPDKELLEKRSKELGEDKKYYSLSKLIYKKDLNDKLVVPIGIDKDKEKYFLDLKNVSGIFIAGETGSGKSVFLNSIIISLLLKNSPNELKFVFIDPRNVEFNIYKEIPHLLLYPVSNNSQSIILLEKINNLIDKRKDMFKKISVKNIDEYNEKSEEKIPHLVVIIDEAVNLFNSKKEIEKILMYSSTFGIHLIISTSSYLKEIFGEKLLNKFEYILTFDLASAEQANYIKLKGSHLLTVSGEALVKCRDNLIIDIQTPFVSDADIKEVVNFIVKEKIEKDK